MYNSDVDYEVAVIGGGLSGLGAALTLARSRVSVVVIDDKDAALYKGVAHNFITNDGRAKADIIAGGMADLGRYPDATQYHARAVAIERDAFGYEISLSDGKVILSRRVIFALGYGYEKNAMGIDGFDERFGQDIFTCPYCHGYELSDRRIALIGTNERDGIFLKLLSNWTSQLHYISHAGPATSKLGMNFASVSEGIALDGKAVRVEGQIGSPVVTLDDGRRIEADAVYVGDLPFQNNSALIDALGIERGLHPMTGKAMYKTDATGRTDLGDAFIIGDARTGFSTLVGAAHEGMIAGVMLANDIIETRHRVDPASAMQAV